MFVPWFFHETNTKSIGVGMSESQAVGARVKALRNLRFLTQEELARKAGISTRTLQAIESGKSPRPSSARKIARALGITPEDLNSSEVAA